MNPPTGQQLELIKQAIFSGRKIEAIKLHREATGAGLKDSKEAVEQLETELRKTDPHRLENSTSASGCLKVLVLGLAAAIAVLSAVPW